MRFTRNTLAGVLNHITKALSFCFGEHPSCSHAQHWQFLTEQAESVTKAVCEGVVGWTGHEIARMRAMVVRFLGSDCVGTAWRRSWGNASDKGAVKMVI